MSEAWPVVLVLMAMPIELAHIATSYWMDFLFYSGDSLTLVLLRQSLVRKESFQWVFSSQFNLFPDGLVYFISSILTTSIRASLVMNAIINVILFYVLMRVIVGIIYPKKGVVKQIFAVIATLILITEMLLERVPSIDHNTIATLYLFNTYYYGVILSALAVLAVILALSRRKDISIRSNLWLYSISIIISGLTTFSNPLFIIQFEIPFVILLVLLKLFRLINYKRAIYLFIATSGTIFGYFLRLPFKDLVGQPPIKHINTDYIHAATSLIYRSFITDLKSVTGIVELFLAIGVILVGIYFSVNILILKRKRLTISHLQLLIVSLFGLISSVVCLSFTALTGQVTTRYLLPDFTFPILSTFWFLSVKYPKQLYKTFIVIVCLLFLGIAIVGLLSLKSDKLLLSTTTNPAISCLAKSLEYKPANGVAPFGIARQLDVYGPSNERVLQINGGGVGVLYPWLANLSAYNNKNFSFLIISNPPSAGSGWGSYTGAISSLGTPSSVASCQSFWVFIYDPSSTGYKTLNDDIQKSYNRLHKLQQEGYISSYF